jgi:hypothetical protein
MLRSSAPTADGYSLPAVLLALLSLSVLSTAAFMVALTEHRVTQSEEAALRAFYAADSGLNTVMGLATGYPADTTVLATAGDTTIVTATRLFEDSAGRRLYLLRSDSRHRSPDGSIGERTLSLVLMADPDSTLRPPSVKRGTWREAM